MLLDFYNQIENVSKFNGNLIANIQWPTIVIVIDEIIYAIIDNSIVAKVNYNRKQI